MSIGDRVEMTQFGRQLAKERRLLPAPGEVREFFHQGRRSEQIYVRRYNGGCEWWPTKAWVVVIGATP